MSRTLCSYVDPFIGVDGDANCICGPFLPFSMARPGPDTVPPHPPNGYETGKPIAYFSQNHVSGTGGSGRYGNIGIMPFCGRTTALPDAQMAQDESSMPGYYRVKLVASGVGVEISSTPRSAVYRFTFPENSDANVLIDAGTVIRVGRGVPGEGQGLCIGGFSEIVGDREVIGRSDCKGGWGHNYPYSVYFYAVFEKPFRSFSSGVGSCMYAGRAASGAGSKAVLSFGHERELVVRIGISYVSVANAKSYVLGESTPFSFDEIRKKAESIWEDRLSFIKVNGGDDDAKKFFYTSMYRLLCMPTDLGIDEENHLWKSGVRSFTDYYCLWDSVRNANSLIGLIFPDKEVELLNSLLDVAEHRGWLPDAWIAGHNAHVQGGSSADILFCEAALKGLKGIDYEKALSFMRKNNESESPDPYLFGRYAADYNSLGYVPDGVINCVSRNIEYSYQDNCIARLAEQLGHKDVAEKYRHNSRRLWNLWRDDIKSFAPKRRDGSWVEPFTPLVPVRKDYWNDPYFYEGTGCEWSLCGLHDIAGLVERHGGPGEFASRLDRFFGKDLYNWKEMILHTPYLYHYAGQPAKSADMTRRIIREKYSARRDGLPDNEDMGAHSAFYMCSAMGLYPVMGQDIYWLSVPFFNDVEFRIENSDSVVRIRTEGDTASQYIKALEINGKRVDRAWLRHEELVHGAEIRLLLGPDDKGFGAENPPPSLL